MAISTSQILSPTKDWKASLTLDGEAVPLAEGMPKRSLGFTQKRGTCTLQTASLPGAPAGAAAVVTIRLNGEPTVFFTGKLDARPISDLPLSYEIGLVDSLARLSAPLKKDLVWNGRAYVDAVRDLLHAAGIGDGEIASIYNPGAHFKLGPVDTITIAKGTDIGGTLDTLLAFGGCGLFVLPDGQLDVADAPGWPKEPAGDTPVYAFGAATDEFGFIDARRTMTGQEGAVAAFTAKGPRLSTKSIPDATFTITGAVGSTVVETYPYCQSEACAKDIASREIVRRNRAATEVDVTAPLNPNMRPGDTIWFRHPELDFPTNTLAIVIGTTTTDDTMTMAISVGARPADGTITVIPPPRPSFTMRYETQPVSLAGIMAVSTVVECTDTSTDPSGFSITSHSWAAACSGSVKPSPETVEWSYDEKKSPTQNPIPNPVFIFPTLEGATITLTVESTSGEGASAVQAIAPAEAERFTRSLSVAAGAEGWRILAGATGWRSFTASADCTAVPNINDQGPLIAGFANGELYRSSDRLLSPPDLLYTFPGAVGCLFVNEGFPAEVLAAAAQTLLRSRDGGESWASVFAFEDVIQYCESSMANPNEIRVCAGSRLFISMDGMSFAPLLEGPTGTVCRKVASAPWGHLAVWAGTEGDVQAAEDVRPWQFEEGHSIDWSGVPVDKMPWDISSVTAMQYEAGYIVAAGDVCDLVRDGLYGQLTYLANAGTVIPLYRLIQAAPGQFVASYLTAATMGGAHKLVNHGGVFPIDTAAQAYRIGYGAAIDPARPPELAVLPLLQNGASDQLYHYLPMLGWQVRALPEQGVAWRGIDICPRNGSEWLIWNDERIYWSVNAGQSWTQIFTPPWDSFSMRDHHLRSACFTGKGSTWAFAISSSDGFNNVGTALVIGEGSQRTHARIAGSCNWPHWPRTIADRSQMRTLTNLTRGYDGELWALGGELGVYTDNYDRQVWIDAAGPTITEVGVSPYAPAALRDPAAGRAGVSVWSSNVGLTPNYRASVPTAAIAAGGSVAVCSLGVFAGNRAGLAQILTIDTAPALQVVAGGDRAVGQVVAGSLGLGVGAPSAGASQDGSWRIFAHNGVQWGAVDTPTGLTAICPRIGVIER